MPSAPPLEPPPPLALQPGAVAYVTQRTEGLWVAMVDDPPSHGTPGMVVFERGAARRLLRTEGELSLLAIYPQHVGVISADRSGDEAFAWLPTHLLSPAPVPLATRVPAGELAYLPALPLETHQANGSSLAFTSCGVHEIVRRELGDDAHTMVAQYDSGVEVRGWLRWDVPRVLPVDCRARTILHRKPREAPSEELYVLGQADLREEFDDLFFHEQSLYSPAAHGFDVACEATRMVKTATGCESIDEPIVAEDGTGMAPKLAIERSEGISFLLQTSTESTYRDGRKRTFRRICPPIFEIAAITDGEIRAAMHRSTCDHGHTPYAVSESALRGWYRSEEACEAAISPLKAWLANPKSDPTSALEAPLLMPP